MSGILESLNGTTSAAIQAVLNSMWQAAALAAAAWVAMRFSPRMNAATRHVVWWAVLAVMVVLPLTPAMLTGWQAINEPAPLAVRGEANSPAPVEVESRGDEVGPAVRAEAPVELHAGAWPTWIAAVWAMALLLQLGRIAWSYRYLRSVKRRARRALPELRRNFDAWMLSCGVHRPTHLLVSEEIVSPMALGFRQPAVLLPAPLLEQFEEKELDHVLLHELAHIARRDDWSNLCGRLAGALLALHPVAAWVLRQVERERELACDDWVVSMTGAPRPYAASLARLFEVCFSRRRMLLASGMAQRPSHLGERIQMLLHRRGEYTSKASMARVVLCGTVLLVLAIASSQAPGWLVFAQDAPQPPARADAPRAAEAPLPPAPALAPTPRPGATPEAPEAPRAEATPAPDQTPAPAVAPLPPQTPPPAKNGSFLAALAAAGYSNLPVDEIITMREAGVTAQYLYGMNQAGLGRLSAQEIIDLCHRGVNPDYIRKMTDAGIRNLTLKDVMELSTYGVRPALVQEIHALGFGPYTAKQAIQFAQYGMRIDLFRALKDAGLTNATPEEILQAHQYGLDARDLREARQYGSSLTLQQILKLKVAGVI